MKSCPICKTKDIGLIEIEGGLAVRKCYSCDGVWMPFNEYLDWKRSNLPADDSFHSAGVVCKRTTEMASAQEVPVLDSDKPVLCPDCGTFLRRYRITPFVSFSLDRCSSCNGIWFDGNEWLQLKRLQLHGRVNEFFTKPWQQWVWDGDRQQRIQSMYQQELGEDDYIELRRIRQWLRSHPKQARLMAYLMDSDPYRL